ncbi:MAG: proline--tRNA ligase, partial [Clostridia bacterium]|nr:proline--tRNA ligase [Clostridia bacterium]
ADEPAVKECAEKLVKDLEAMGVQVLYDDRPVSAGFMFSDADLLGVPLRIIASPRNLKENCCEIVSRDKTISMKTEIGEIVETVKKLISEMM